VWSGSAIRPATPHASAASWPFPFSLCRLPLSAGSWRDPSGPTSPRRNCKPRLRGPYASLSHTFPSFARRLPRALPIWSPGGFLGACRSCGQKIAHILADIVGWYLRSQVSSPIFVGPLPATRAVGRCEATDAVPTGTRRRRPIPHRSGRNSALLCVCNAFASARLCRSLLSFAFHLASHVVCRERAPRRERDGSMQLQPGTARTTVRACRVRKNIHPTLRIRMVNRASS
jgi:hypothetical protein